jgi:hypothetical protein
LPVAETVGALIIAGIETAGVEGASAFGASTIAAGLTVNTAVGAGAIFAATVGLSAALQANTALPKPEDGAQALKQAVPSRIRGYWDNRLAGAYMLYEEANRTSYDVIAFHHGKVESIRHVYLHDQEVVVSPDVSTGGVGTVAPVGADQFGGGRVQIEIKLGDPSQAPSALYSSDSDINTVWTASYRGDGVAYACLKCGALADPAIFSRIYPQGKPELSVVARCSPIWDPRDLAQSRGDETTWVASANPVLQLIDYLTRADGGMGFDYDTIIAPIISAWIVEADICDEPVGGIPRYASAGWYRFDNKPEDVIGKILATCDGYLMETGDGTLAITVGKYREPAGLPLTDEHIFGFSINHGIADEQTVNQLEITYTDPNQQYASAQTDPVRDEISISQRGVVRSQPLDLSWVPNESQALRLGNRALLRLNADTSGQFVTSLRGLQYLGQRWIKMRYSVVNGLQDCILEVQSVEVNTLAGRVNWSFVRIVPPIGRLDLSGSRNSMYEALLFDDI